MNSFIIDELQLVLNLAARLLLILLRFERVLQSMVKECLHWLCLTEHITYKLYTLTLSLRLADKSAKKILSHWHVWLNRLAPFNYCGMLG